ncbi:MAG: response regulator [Deltaproteobacteria bacterium]|nr:response regulator [Deltaproteobacteria bacterium]
MARKHLSIQPSGYTILVVDDQEEIRLAMQYLLEREGHQVLTAASGAAALALFRAHPIDLALIDYVMPRMNGEQLVQAIRQFDEDMQIVLQTGYSGEKPPRDMLRSLAIQGYHDKSEGPDRLLLWVDVALKAAAQIKKIRLAEREREESRSQLRRLSARLLHVQEQERVRISRELHDHLGQLLTAIGMNLDWALLRRPPDAPAIAERLQETRQLVQEVINAIRELSATLRPAELHGVGLDVVMGEHVRDFERRSGLDVHFSCALRKDSAIPSEMATNVYRIVQESLTNVARYADATEVGVLLHQSDHELTVSISDNGKGFDVSHVTDPHAVGLIGMHERARLIGGTLVIRSTPGAGTTVSLAVPLGEKGQHYDLDPLGG